MLMQSKQFVMIREQPMDLNLHVDTFDMRFIQFGKCTIGDRERCMSIQSMFIRMILLLNSMLCMLMQSTQIDLQCGL